MAMTETEERPEQEATVRSELRERQALIPVTNTGVQIVNLDQQIDYAQSMAKAMLALPKHLRGKVGDCLAVIDIASRAGLSPFMVASKTYSQNDRLCFESQLFHAFAQSSGLLKGDLDVEWKGEGGDRVCVVTGYLRSDPTKPRVLTSPELRDLHPGFVLKKREDNETSKRWLTYVEGEKMRAEGKVQEGYELFSRGSPLWVRKPDVQMFYDTSRDWVRLFCPRAVLGIYTPEEVAEYGPEMARDVTPPTSGVAARLTEAGVDRTEGHQGAASAAADVGEAKNGEARKVDPDTPIKDVEAFPAGAKKVLAEVETLSALLQMTEAEVGALKGCGPAMLEKIKAAVEKCGWSLRAESTPQSPSVGEVMNEARKPRNVAEWTVYARAWVADAVAKQLSGAVIRRRWKDEIGLRNDCGVVSTDRDPVEKEMKAAADAADDRDEAADKAAE